MVGDPTHDGGSLQSWSTEALAERIAELDRAYFQRGESLVPDATYDRLKDELRRRDPAHPALAAVGAPVDAEPGDKVEHAQPMLSLDKCTTYAALWAWYRGALAGATDRANSARLDDEATAWSATPQGALVAVPKIDGLACSLRYGRSGVLLRAATRGDGRVGEDVTANARKVPTVVQRLPADRPGDGELEVRGEIYLPLPRFAEVADSYANPRNLAAGTLKAKDNPAIDPSWLAFFAYDLLGAPMATESRKFEVLAQMGFVVPAWRMVRATEAQAVFDQYEAARATDTFEADGIVLRLDDCALAQRLGVTAHHPRGAIAWKYAASTDTTTLQNIHWSVARTGTITPVALVAPVDLSGATVTRATLHNLSRVRQLGLRPGDVVEIVRRGGVIPHVERVVTPSGEPQCEPPSHCPSCGTATRVVARDDGKGKAVEVLLCGDPANCVTARQRSLLHYCQALELEGFGDKVVETLIDQGLCDNPADLYELTAEDLRPLPRFGEILVSNLLGQIARARRVELPAFLVALGIAALGKQTAQLLANRGDLTAIAAMTVQDIAQLHSLGEKTAAAIVAGLADKADLIAALRRHVDVVRPVAVERAGAGPMAGEVVVFTGALPAMGRRDAQQLVVRLGGIAGDSVTAETTLLVVGGDELDAAEPSSKLKKARKLQASGGAIRIERADAFFARVQGEP